jgi:hypothetical protein
MIAKAKLTKDYISLPRCLGGVFLQGLATLMIPQEYFAKVKKHFRGDDKKAWLWFQSIHPSFGMLSPLNMIKLKREKTVKEFIDKEMK